MAPKFEMSTYFYSNIIWLQSGHKISTLMTFYLKTGDQKQKAKIVFCVCHGPEKGSKYHLETVQTTSGEINNYYRETFVKINFFYA